MKKSKKSIPTGNSDVGSEGFTSLCDTIMKTVKVKKEPLNVELLLDLIEHLELSLIPDLKESGHECTAEDFESCVLWMRDYANDVPLNRDN